MQRYTVYLYLQTVLHVSSGISTHHQELISLYVQYLALLRPLLLPVVSVAGWEMTGRSHSLALLLVKSIHTKILRKFLSL